MADTNHTYKAAMLFLFFKIPIKKLVMIEVNSNTLAKNNGSNVNWGDFGYHNIPNIIMATMAKEYVSKKITVKSAKSPKWPFILSAATLLPPDLFSGIFFSSAAIAAL